MTFISRAVGLLLWAAAAAVSIWLTFKLTGGDQIITALSLLAIAAGSFTLIIARDAWRKGAYPEFAINLLIFIVSVLSTVFLDISYYSSSITSARTREEVAAITRDTQQLMLTKAKQAYSASGEIRSPGEIKALMDAAAVKFGPRSPEYFKLKADHEAAIKTDELKRDIWAVGTSLENVDVSRNLSAAAHFFHRTIGGNLETWVTVAVLTPVCLLLLIMHGGLFASTSTRRLNVQPSVHFVSDKSGAMSDKVSDNAFATPDGTKPALPPFEPASPRHDPSPVPPKPGKKKRTLSELLASLTASQPRELKVVGGTDLAIAPERRDVGVGVAQCVLAISAARSELEAAHEAEIKSDGRQVTEGMRAVMRIVQQWLDDHWEDDPLARPLRAKDAFESFDRWRHNAGFDEIKGNSFGRSMKQLGYVARHTKRGMTYHGARLTNRPKMRRAAA